MEPMTIKQVAERLGLSTDAVYDLCQTKQLAHFRIGRNRGRIRISPGQLEAYMQSNEEPAEPLRGSSSVAARRPAAPAISSTPNLDRYQKRRKNGGKSKKK